MPRGRRTLTIYVKLGLTVLALAALAVGLTLSLGRVFPGFGPIDPAARRVPEGVRVVHGDLAVDLGGRSRYEAVGQLEDEAYRLTRPAVSAYLDPATRGAVPGIAGQQLDVAATVEAALAAAPGATVAAVLTSLPPTVGLDDFPTAPLFNGNPDRPAVAVILNIAWGDEHLDGIISLFERAGARLTICPVGEWLDGNAERAAWIAAAAERGHEIGNHGYYNRPMTYPDPRKVRDEIQRTSDLIEAACGRRPAIFAPPMGERSPTMLEAAAGDGYRTVIWSLDTIDWRLEGVDVIYQRVASRVKAGDIILSHPTPQTGPAFARLLPVIAEKGLTVVTVSELIAPEEPAEASGDAPAPPSDP